MNAETISCKAGRGWRSIETWLIVLLIAMSGVAIGYPLGDYSARHHADLQIQEIRDAYSEATQAKADLLARCIYSLENGR